MNTEDKLKDDAKRYVLRTKQILKEFPNYPKAWLNKLVCSKVNITEPVSKQIRSYCEYERKHTKELNNTVIIK